MPPALLALAMAAFAIGTTEFMIVGLIPTIARSLSVSVPAAGLLVSSYALAVTIGAPTVTAFTGHLPRRALAIRIMGLFTFGNLIAAFAPVYGVLLAGRVVTGVAHGVFFSIGAAIAVSLVDRSRASRVVALVFAGLTVAMVVGVPLGTFVGQQLGWRAPFLAVAALGAIATAALGKLLPKQIPHAPPARLVSQFALIGKSRLLALYLVASLGFGAPFVVFTFLSPLMTEVTHVSEATVSLALMVFGIAAVVGNLAGGKLGDVLGRRQALTLALAGLILTLVALPITAPHTEAMFVNLFAWGICNFCVAPIVQAGVVAVAEDEMPASVATASGFNIAAFNLGISAASAVGGALVAGPGVMATPWAAASAATVALVTVRYAGSPERQAASDSWLISRLKRQPFQPGARSQVCAGQFRCVAAASDRTTREAANRLNQEV